MPVDGRFVPPVRGPGIRALVVFVLLATWGGPAPARALGSPAVGKVLVATERLRGPFFSESVILLLDHGSEGSLGLVVNRPTPVSISEVLAEPLPEGRVDAPLFGGGPVAPSTLTALVRRGPGPGWETVIHGVARVETPEALEVALSSTDVEVRIYAGYAGWAPGQLDDEIRRGSWHLLEASAEWVFSHDPEALWETLERLATSPLV